MEGEHTMEELQSMTTNIKLRKHIFANQDVTIQAFEQECNITIPAVYRRFLSLYDGGILDETIYDQDGCSFYIEMFFGFSGTSETFSTLKGTALFQEFIQKGFLPIAKDAFGNYILLNIRGKQYGSVHFFAHDEQIHYQFLTYNFLQFLQLCKSDVDMFQYGVYTDVILYVTKQDDQEMHDNMIPNDIDRILDEEMQPHKHIKVQELMDAPEPFQEGFLHFDHFPFKLLIIQKLMYQQDYLPEFNIYDAFDKYGLDPENDLKGPEPYLFALRYFKELLIPVELAQYVDELTIDSKHSIYYNLNLHYRLDDKRWMVHEVSNEELSQFTNLKKVINQSVDAASFVYMLRMRGIEVEDTMHMDDYTATHILELLQHPEQCLQIQMVNGETFLQLLRAVFGGYYQALFSEDLQLIAMQYQEIDHLDRFQWMIQVFAEALRKQDLTLIRCIFPEEVCQHYIITCDIKKLRQRIITWNGAPFRIQYDMKTMQWSILPMLNNTHPNFKTAELEQTNATSKHFDKTTPKRIKTPYSKKKRLIFVCFILFCICMFIFHLLYNQHVFYTYYEDFERGFQTVSNSNNDNYLEDLKGNRLLEESFRSIIPTYSVLILLHGEDVDGIYDIDQKQCIHGFFRYATIINLKKDGKQLDYEGILATKDDRHWYLYTAEHKEGVEIQMDKEQYSAYFDDTIDLDTYTLLREE